MKYSMFIGRWQPWHKGHRWLIDQRLNENKNVLICIRDMETDENNPYTPQEQLKIVLPRKSLNLLREPIKNIEDYPEDATECYLLKRYLWESYYKI